MFTENGVHLLHFYSLNEFILYVYDMSNSMSGVGNLNKQNKNKQNSKNSGSNL